MSSRLQLQICFFFNDTATTEIYTLSLHDALPISAAAEAAPRMLPTGKESGAMGSSRCRVALYSHDTMGLGHMRRNLLLAQALRHSRLQAVVLLIARAREASAPPGAARLGRRAPPPPRQDGNRPNP